MPLFYYFEKMVLVVVLAGWGGFRCVVPLRPAVRLASAPFCSQRFPPLVPALRHTIARVFFFALQRTGRRLLSALTCVSKGTRAGVVFFFGSPLLTSLHPSFHRCNPGVIITR